MIVKIIVAGLIIGVMVGLFILTYLLNVKTPKPEGAENPNCNGCGDIFCSHNPAHDKQEEKEN